MTTPPTRSTATRTLIAAAVTAATAGLAGPAVAAPLPVQSGALTWNVPRETSPYTLAGYAASIGAGSVDAAAPATGASITPASVPAAGAGVTYPYRFPAAAGAGAGSYDPDTKTGTINLQGTLTFTAHSSTFLSIVNPSIVFDAPQSARVVANGLASPPMSSPDPAPVAYGTGPARQTVFALNASAATTTVAQDGSYTIDNLIPSGTPQSAPTSFISSNTAFDGVRTFFGTSRPNQAFSVSFTPAGTTPPTPTPTPAPTTTDTPAAPATSPIVAATAPVILYTTTFRITSRPFGAKKVDVSIRKPGKGQKTIGRGTLAGTTLKIKLPTGTTLKGKYVLSRKSGSKKLPKSATVTLGSPSRRADR